MKWFVFLLSFSEISFLGTVQAQQERVILQQPVMVSANDESLQKCNTNASRLKYFLNGVFSPFGPVTRSLKNLNPNGLDPQDLNATRIKIEPFLEEQSLYRAFFSPHNERGGMITLDCSQESVHYWPELVAHEFTHLYLKNFKTAFWFEEMVAQQIEYDVRKIWPSDRIAALYLSNILPSLFEEIGPLQSTSAYSLNFLLGHYLLSKKGWHGLQSLQTVSAIEFDHLKKEIIEDFFIRLESGALDHDNHRFANKPLAQISGIRLQSWQSVRADARVLGEDLSLIKNRNLKIIRVNPNIVYLINISDRELQL